MLPKKKAALKLHCVISNKLLIVIFFCEKRLSRGFMIDAKLQYCIFVYIFLSRKIFLLYFKKVLIIIKYYHKKGFARQNVFEMYILYDFKSNSRAFIAKSANFLTITFYFSIVQKSIILSAMSYSKHWEVQYISLHY